MGDEVVTDASLPQTTKDDGEQVPVFARDELFKPQFLELMELGLPITDSCYICEISPSTFYNWRKKAEDGDELYQEFMIEVAKHRALCKSTLVRRVVKASEDPKNWAAAMTLLERLFPQDYGRRDTHVVEEEKNVNINVKSVSAEEVAKRRELERKEREALEGEVI